MTKICVVTGTRAEYGILSELMGRMRDSSEIELQIVATNMHLMPEYGMTVSEIIEDGFEVDWRVPMPLEGDSAKSTVKGMAAGLDGFAEAFDALKPDMVMILGDRYEMLMVASAALIFRIPVIHLHGGEITEGAYDDSIRHAITKLSTWHFTATERYRKRVIQMGEDPERVFCSGSPATDGITRFATMSLPELEESIGFELGEDFLLCTFHPVTTQPGDEERQTAALLNALDQRDEKVLFTMPNSDTGGRRVAEMIAGWTSAHPGRAIAVTSLGRKRYYSALAHCGAVIGNSSSGLIEAPSFGVPTLNIGDRQRGRDRGNTVIDCKAEEGEITVGLQKVMSQEFRSFCRNHGENPYHREGTVDYIMEKILTFNPAQQKSFHDIEPV